jgi:hypothetical protein
MVPATFTSYFVAMSGADAALLGLLFVAVSINPEHIFSRGSAPERLAVAANAFFALTVAFFVSATALLPGVNVGGTGVFMAGIGVFTSVRLGVQITRYHVRSKRSSQPLWLRLFRSLFTVAGGLVLYGYLFTTCVQLVIHPTYVPAVVALAILVLVCCGLGLFRAWELLGAPRVGVLAGWLNPLQAPDEEAPPSPAAAASERAATAQARIATTHRAGDSAQIT